MRAMRQQDIDTDNGEFFCPLCRQMANALLPVSPAPPLTPAVAWPEETDDMDRDFAVAQQILTQLKEENGGVVRRKPPS